MKEKDDIYTIRKFFADFIEQSLKAIIKFLETGKVEGPYEIEEHFENTEERKDIQSNT